MKHLIIGLTVASYLLLSSPALAGRPEPEFDSGNCVWRGTISSWEGYRTMSNIQRNAMRGGYDLSCDSYFMELKNAR